MVIFTRNDIHQLSQTGVLEVVKFTLLLHTPVVLSTLLLQLYFAAAMI